MKDGEMGKPFWFFWLHFGVVNLFVYVCLTFIPLVIDPNVISINSALSCLKLREKTVFLFLFHRKTNDTMNYN